MKQAENQQENDQGEVNVTTFSKTEEWLRENASFFPPEVLECLSKSLEIIKNINENGNLTKKNIGLRIEFLKKMGIIASSEKSSTLINDIKGDKDENPEDIVEKIKKELEKNALITNKNRKKIRVSFINLSKLRKLRIKLEEKLEMEKLSREELQKALAEMEQEKIKADLEESTDIDEDFPDEEIKEENEPELEPIAEAMFAEPVSHAVESEIICKLDPEIAEVINGKTKTFYSRRIRFDIDFSVNKQNYLIEEVYSYEQDNLFSSKVPDVGPKGFRVTYNTISTVVLMVVSYYIPINRLSKMLNNHNKAAFHSSSICRYLSFFAECALPVYLELFEGLSETKVLNCDDTTTRTVETSERIKNQKNGKEESEKKVSPENKVNLFDQVKDFFGFTSMLKSGSGPKVRLNVSCLIGKSEEKDSKSYIVFYRTHLGSCGNLIDKMLEIRTPLNKNLKIQSDLSDTNYPQELKVTEKFTLEKFGCLAHSRRDFFKYRKLEPELSSKILEEFKMIAVYENEVKECGITEEHVFAARFLYEKKCLQKILEYSNEILKKWAPKSEMAKTASYFINNYELISKYIDHPEIEPTNNVAERLLRGEKLMLNSSKFRKTENGRVIYDICRTLIATCNAAQIPLKEYFHHIMKNKDDIKENPGKYTPYYYAKNHHPNSNQSK